MGMCTRLRRTSWLSSHDVYLASCSTLLLHSPIPRRSLYGVQALFSFVTFHQLGPGS